MGGAICIVINTAVYMYIYNVLCACTCIYTMHSSCVHDIVLIIVIIVLYVLDCLKQAVLASDFNMGRFKFLKKLLLVHGHWCYSRLANMMLYFFYKNIVRKKNNNNNNNNNNSNCHYYPSPTHSVWEGYCSRRVS